MRMHAFSIARGKNVLFCPLAPWLYHARHLGEHDVALAHFRDETLVVLAATLEG